MNFDKLSFGKRICFITLLIAAVFACVGSPTARASANDNEDDLYDRIGQYLSETVPKTHFPSFSVVIVDRDNVLFSETYGSLESTDVPYLLGSVSKSFTALCIMQLAEQGKVDLNAHLCEYLPDATDGDQITILQLLNHTGGLGEHQNLGNYKIVNAQGTHLYANVNYSLLGKVIEAVSGMSFEEYVTENVLEPLGMNETAANPDAAKRNGLIQGYENWFGFQIKTECKYRNTESAWITVPAGYLSSSADDLGKYLQMYLNGDQTIISAESINEMFYHSVAVEGSIPYQYGMGWTLVKEPLNQPVLRHSGHVETGMSCIYLLPESNIGVAVALNVNDYLVGANFADRIGWGIILMLTGEEPNQINSGEYIGKHLTYDAICLAVLLLSLLPILSAGRYQRNFAAGRLRGKVILLFLLHFVLPAFILMVSYVFLDTPLWVARAFVPDLYFVVVLSACLLLSGGILKVCLIAINSRKGSPADTPTPDSATARPRHS